MLQPRSTTLQNSTTVRSRNAVRWARVAVQAAYLVSEGLGTTVAERLFSTPRRHARPARERAILASGRPFQVPVQLRSPQARGAKVELAAWRWGHGPTVLLVHGWEGRGTQLGAFVEPLVAAGFSVVAFDAPGHGDSAGNRLYLTDHADAIADVAAYVGPVHGVVAHSFGVVALLVAHLRHGFDPLRNVAIAPNVLLEDAFTRFARTVALDDADRAALELSIGAHAGISPSALDLPRLASGRDAGLLVFHDRDDREVPFLHGHELASVWPNAQLRPTTGLGHRKILRDPDVVASAVTFLREGVRAPASDLIREVDRYLDARP
ncbi:MAG: alpha/beta fold hydrolase [Deltaproteobacteria bacterium]|nr:alpha/beta fold hydrolase [Deltaproteobacteria bacterium]